jgi:mono/diheme cytochrome c family protein
MTKNKKPYLIFYPLFILFLTILIISCGKRSEDDQITETDTVSEKTTETIAESPGRTIFYMKSDENNIACADCHSDGTNTDRPLTKYFSDIIGANRRDSTYHGMFIGEEVETTAGGATICWEAYLRKKTKLTGEEIAQLNEFYSSLAPDIPSAVKEYETIALPVRDKRKLRDEQKEVAALKGDPVNGEKLFNDGCTFCHGINSEVKKVPDILDDFEGNVRSVTYMVRLGDAAMPFFHKGVLSDQEIADIAAYLMRK